MVPSDGDDSVHAFFDFFRVNHPEFLKIVLARSDDEFDDGLEALLEGAVDYLEKEADNLAKWDEVAITGELIAYLSAPGLRVTKETHSKGHVDITIEAERRLPVRRRLGEAKIYDGPAYHVKGLEQLINRYVTGREGSSFLIEYVKKDRIRELVAQIRADLDLKKPCGQNGSSEDHRIRWAFTTLHRHSSGEDFRVLHLSCNLFVASAV